jgi:hypothetical protein
MVRRIATVSPIKLPAVLPDTVPACHDLIERRLQRLDVLEERARLNSSNSSKPPSSDGPGTPPRTTKAQSGKRLGGQPGHKGSLSRFLARGQAHEQGSVPASTPVHGLRLYCSGRW